MGLSEPKVRQRINDDPRNMQWVNDKSKFGHRMLEKMGWTEGKGLGRTQSGRVEHIKISKKDDFGGIGAKKDHSDNWLETNDAFSELLKSMNTEIQQTVTIPEPSPRGNANVSQSRLGHRRRHIKANNMAIESPRDLNAVLGSTGSGKSTERNGIVDPMKNVINDRCVSKYSISEYFELKMKQREQADKIASCDESEQDRAKRKADRRKRRKERKARKEERRRKREEKRNTV